MVTSNKQLQEQNDKLQRQMSRMQAQLAELLGNRAPAQPPEIKDRPDYIEHGSAKHAKFLGLIIVPDDEIEKAQEGKYILFTSPTTKITYRLLDELTILRHYPSIDPSKAALIVLRQHVSSLESGKPKVPDSAPPLLWPEQVR